MAKNWILDTDTKGTGAHVRPLEDVLEGPAETRRERPAPRPRPRGTASERAPLRGREPAPTSRSSTPLAPGQVRKKSTGEIGRVRSVDPKAGSAVVHWLKQGRTSTVPLSAITRTG